MTAPIFNHAELTKGQRFLKLQLDDLEVSPRWKKTFIDILSYRRMIILDTVLKSQLENISRLNNREVYKLAQDFKNPSITLSLLEKTSIDLYFA